MTDWGDYQGFTDNRPSPHSALTKALRFAALYGSSRKDIEEYLMSTHNDHIREFEAITAIYDAENMAVIRDMNKIANILNTLRRSARAGLALRTTLGSFLEEQCLDSDAESILGALLDSYDKATEEIKDTEL